MLDYGIVKSCRQTCLCQISREIGFTEESIKSFEPFTSLHAFAPYHPSLVMERMDDYHFEIPSVFCRMFHEHNSDTWQLFSEGNLDLILESTPDYWNGSGLGSMNDYVKKKLAEFYQNATLSDMQVVAYAYRPIPFERIPIPHSKSHIYIELDSLSSTTIQQEEEEEESQKRNSLPRLGFCTDRISSQVDKEENEPLQESQFYQEVIKGQTFLGLVSFLFQPKPVIFYKL